MIASMFYAGRADAKYNTAVFDDSRLYGSLHILPPIGASQEFVHFFSETTNFHETNHSASQTCIMHRVFFIIIRDSTRWE